MDGAEFTRHVLKAERKLYRIAYSMNQFPVKPVLPILLQDKTTKKNIIWATGSYKELGTKYADDVQMTTEALIGMDAIMLQPRVLKAQAEQQERTKAHAEVFTPSWVCNTMAHSV